MFKLPWYMLNKTYHKHFIAYEHIIQQRQQLLLPVVYI